MALFTAETAVAAAKLSHAPTSARFAKPVEAQPTPEPPQPATEPADVYTSQVLARVRVQLNLVNSALTNALEQPKPDAQAIDRLASAQMRLAEQERILAGRPLPGSRKPAPDRADRRQGRSVVVYDMEVSQTVSQATTSVQQMPINIESPKPDAQDLKS